MPRQRVLLFDGNSLSALRWQAGRVVADRQFAATPEGHAELAQFAHTHRNDLFHLLADIPEEGFQLETVPFVRGGDRAALLKRRLAQYYYGTPLSTAISLGRNADGRRDERIQFAALTRPEMLVPWLDALASAHAPLTGVYSVPLVLADQKWVFAEGKERFLLCTISTGGLRQTYFVAGKMMFSRLTALPAFTDDAVAEGCNAETNRTIQYLVGQRQLTRGTRLPAYVLCHPSLLPTLRKHCIDSADVGYEFIDMAGFAGRVGSKTALKDSRADALFVHMLMARPPAVQFAPEAVRQPWRRWQMRSALRISAAAVLIGALALAARFTTQADTLSARTEALESQSFVDAKRYETLLAGLPKTPLSNDALRAVIARFDELAARNAEIAPMLRHLGRALEAAPGIELDRLAWQVGDKPASGERANSSRGGTAPVPVALSSAPPWVTLEIDAALPAALLGDQRRQLAAIDALAERLRSNGIEVEVLATPVNIESAKSLRSIDYADSDDDTRPASKLAFALRLTQQLGAKPK